MINSQTTKNLYRGNGSTLSYPVTYPFYEAENLLVLVAVGEVEETLSLGADYSVAINTDGSGGTVTFTSAERVPAGCTIAIMLNMALVQELDLSAVSHIDTESLEQELDKQVQYIQQMGEGLSRAVKTNATSEISPDRLVSSLFAARDESVAAKNAAETAQASAEAAEASAVAAREATETASASAQTTISEAGAAAAAAVSDAGSAQVSAVNAAGADQVTSVNAAGAAQVSSIQSEGTTQVNSVTSTGTSQKAEMQALVTAASGYAELAHTYAQQASPEGVVHLTGDETISGVKTFTQTIAGTAAAAEKLATDRTITLSGAASGSVSFDGSADATLEVSIGENQGAVIGEIRWFAMSTPPEGWLPCNGASVSTSDYAELFAAIGKTFTPRYLDENLKIENPQYSDPDIFLLPNLMGKVPWGTSSQVGTVMEAGLPNIKGQATFINSDGVNNTQYPDSGALYWANYAHNVKMQTISGTGKRDIMIDASRSNNIYGASTTVQPPALCLLPCIRYE